MLLNRRTKLCLTSLIIGAVASIDSTATTNTHTDHPARIHADARKLESATCIACVSEEWAEHWSAKNLDAVVALYADDAVFLPSTGSRVTGRAAIRELFAKALVASTTRLRVQSKTTGQSGDLAYDSGEYEEKATSGGVTRTGHGNYLVILRRVGAGRWLIVEHMWTDAPATVP
jgi:uncharacterized protein (TIGR02246 family)